MITRRAGLLAGLSGCAGPGLAQGRGELALSNTPALASHRIGGADDPALILRWNAPPAPGAALDLVLHFHGFTDDARAFDLRRAMGGSGLDLAPVPESGASAPLLARPTLAMLPRGRPDGRSRGSFDWPALTAPGGLAAVMGAAIAAFTGAIGRGGFIRGRVTLTAHSGGGGGLLQALDQAGREGLRVDRVIAYDALYRSPEPLLRWARATPGASLTVAYGPGSNTENAQAVGRGFPAARLIRAQVAHGDIPRFYGWRLLAEG